MCCVVLGPIGEAGPNGQRGPSGPPGFTGQTGPPGRSGPAGLFYFDPCIGAVPTELCTSHLCNLVDKIVPSLQCKSHLRGGKVQAFEQGVGIFKRHHFDLYAVAYLVHTYT